VVQQLLTNLDKEINNKMQVNSKDSQEYHALDSLQRELIFRREASLRSSIRRLILDNLINLNEKERLIRSKEVVQAYDIRGRLIHDGKVSQDDLNQAHNIASQALIEVLTSKIAIICP
jgi:hypothetical protein